MKKRIGNGERGVALFFAMFALLLLTGIAAALIFMANTETAVNSNYRQEQVAFFAANAGLEEARARMMASDPNTVNSAGTPLPTLAPSAANPIIYITNPGNGAAVKPWLSAGPYADLELCHDGYTGLGLTLAAPDVRCTATSLPAGTYVSYTSQLPFNATANALPYKWVRIAPKVNGSVSYLTGAGATATISNYLVNTNVATYPAATLICWDGAEEVPLKAPALLCSQMLNCCRRSDEQRVHDHCAWSQLQLRKRCSKSRERGSGAQSYTSLSLRPLRHFGSMSSHKLQWQ